MAGESAGAAAATRRVPASTVAPEAARRKRRRLSIRLLSHRSLHDLVAKETRTLLGDWLPQLLEYAAKPWTKESTDKIVEGVPSHGVPAAETTRQVVGVTLRTVVLPGFDSLGVPIAAAREWVARHFDA